MTGVSEGMSLYTYIYLHVCERIYIVYAVCAICEYLP